MTTLTSCSGCWRSPEGCATCTQGRSHTGQEVIWAGVLPGRWHIFVCSRILCSAAVIRAGVGVAGDLPYLHPRVFMHRWEW